MSSMYSFASALSSAQLIAAPAHSYTNERTNLSREKTKSTKTIDQTESLSSFLCHVLYLESKLREEEALGCFIDNNVGSVTSRARLGEGNQFTVYSAEIIFKRPLRHLKANEPGQIIAIKVVRADEE